MTEYIYQQTIVQWRIPILENGNLGHPEIVKKFTGEIKGSQEKYVRKKDQVVQKEIRNEKASKLFEMEIGDEEELSR